VLSEGTIKNHVSSILNKLQAENRTHAVDIARRNGLA
jgi:DNA-binding NarL/FixJ family response regulator